MRWKAPADTTAIHLASGSLTVSDGFVDAPDELSTADISGLRANGFLPDSQAPTPVQVAAVIAADEHED